MKVVQKWLKFENNGKIPENKDKIPGYLFPIQ